MPAAYVTLWEFSVEPSKLAEFETAYGPEGRWARLFSGAPGYLGTELLRDRAGGLRYVTIDRWSSIEAWREFKASFAAEYERLDLECAALTTRESALGEFAPVGGTQG